MNKNEQFVITINRELGSGGRTVGRLLAEKLGVPFYDKAVVKALQENLSDLFLIDDAKIRRFSLDSKFFPDFFLNYMRHTHHFATNPTNPPNLCRAILSQYLSEFRSLAFEDCDVDLDLASGSIGSGILTRQVCCNKEILRATRNLT